MDYDDLAASYDRRYARFEYGGVEGCLWRFARGASGEARSSVRIALLEVGCGTGHWLELLAPAAATLAGIDPSIEMLKRARERVTHAALARARAEALPFANASFDRVVCVNAFHHFADKRGFIAEARRILRPGGGLLICGLDPHTGHERWWIYDYYPGALARDRERFPSTAALCDLVSEAGFVRVRGDEVHAFSSRHVASEALAGGLLDQSSTSQLALLDAAEYRAGIERLRRDIDAAAERGEPLVLDTDLRLRATTAWVDALHHP